MQPPRTAWQPATIREIGQETARIRRFLLAPQTWRRPRAGQHIDIRLTAPDGYTAVRSYSLSSPPETEEVYEIAVELLPDGEVSSYLHEGAMPGDRIEIRGPVGGHFVWDATAGGPLLLVGGGSGLVPLVAMLRHRALAAPGVPAVLCIGARRFEDIPFRDEILAMQERTGLGLVVALSREETAHPAARSGRLDRCALVDALAQLPGPPAAVFACGSNRFVEGVTVPLLDLELPAGIIRTERFGGA